MADKAAISHKMGLLKAAISFSDEAHEPAGLKSILLLVALGNLRITKKSG